MSAILRTAAVATFTLLVVAACSAKSAAPSSGDIPQASSASKPQPMASQCTPAPVPTPQVTLIQPAPGSTGISRTLERIRFEVVDGATTVSRIAVTASSGGSIVTNIIAPVGTPGPNGQQKYNAHVGRLLQAKITYNVNVSGKQTFSGCSTRYTSPAGSFRTR